MLPGVYTIITRLIFSLPGYMLQESGYKLRGNGPVHRCSFSNAILGKRWHLGLVLRWKGRLKEFGLRGCPIAKKNIILSLFCDPIAPIDTCALTLH